MTLPYGGLFYDKTSYSQNHHQSKRVSPCILSQSGIARGIRGSATVEAALAVPLFFLAVVSLLYMMEVMAVRTSIRSGMQYAGKKYAAEAYLKPVVSLGSLERDIVESVGSSRLDRSVVDGGSAGVHCEKSVMSASTAVLSLKVTYKVHLPVPVFKAASVGMQEEMRIKGWNGYVKNGFGTGDNTTVYVTENGIVYHLDYHCSYLDLSIHMVPASGVGDLRNKSEGKYHPCEHCAGKAGAAVYITDYGNRYHSSLGCSGLKRTIYAIPLSEAAGKGACSKCGK